MRKVLLISPYFSSYAGVGVLRMNSLARHLSKSGVEVTILTNDPNTYDRIVENVMPEELIFEFVDASVEGKINSGILQRRWSFIRNVLAYRRRLRTLLSKNDYECLLFSFGPFNNLLNIKWARKKCCSKIVLDFRDPWISCEEIVTDSFKSFLKGLLQRLIMRSADHIVVVSDAMRESFLKFFNLSSEKVVTIFNGYDNEILPDYSNIEVTEVNHNRFILCATGKLSFYSLKNTEILIEAMRQLDFKTKLIHVGEKEQAIDRLFFNGAVQLVSYENLGYMEYAKAISYPFISDVNVIVNSLQIGLGTKVFDYIRANRPILLVGPKNSELALFLDQFSNARCCETTDEIVLFLENVYLNNISNLNNSNSYPDSFSRSVQNERYASIILD